MQVTRKLMAYYPVVLVRERGKGIQQLFHLFIVQRAMIRRRDGRAERLVKLYLSLFSVIRIVPLAAKVPYSQ